MSSIDTNTKASGHDRDAILQQVSRALEARKPDQAWELLAPLAPELPADRELALTWLTLLRVTPGRASLIGDVRRVLERWPTDTELVLAGCDALVRAAELRAPDEPPTADGPEALAVECADRCLEALDDTAKKNPALGGYLQMTRANALRLAHLYTASLEAYRAALATDESNGQWWWNLSLLHKATHAWADALGAMDKARAKLGGDNSAVQPPALGGDKSAEQPAALGGHKGLLWNTAICATALGRGEAAVDALHALGFPATLAPSGMPYVEGMPPAQVRVATRGSGHGVGEGELDRAVLFELVWVTPASPCHGVVQSATRRDGTVDYGDLVLWDGTPIGVGEHEGKPVPRFPLLAVLRHGDERRFRFVALEQEAGDAARFGEDLPNDALYFAHHAKVEHLCARCASGDHMRKHEHTKPEPHRLVYGKLVLPASADLKAFRATFDERLRAHPKVHFVVPGLLEALGETEAAGKAHQLWRGLEKTSIKSGATPRA